MGKYEKLIEKRVQKILKKLPREPVALAMSGGKDSTYLAYLLDKLGFNYDIIYFYLPIEPHTTKQLQYVQKFSEEYGKKLVICDLRHINILKASKLRKRPICSVCGLVKRYYFNKFARDKGYGVLLTGHNLTDIYRFLLINLAAGTLEYSARNLPINEPKHPRHITLAKPLFFVPESYIRQEMEELGLPYYKEPCPYSRDVKWKAIVSFIEEQSPDILYGSVLHFVNKYSNLFLKEAKFKECSVCGEPTSSEKGICSYCRVFSFLGDKKL